VYLNYVVQKINYENRQEFLSPNLSVLIKEGSKIWKNGRKYFAPVHGVYLVLAKVKCIILTRRPAIVTG
jgi:hypothetical protein